MSEGTPPTNLPEGILPAQHWTDREVPQDDADSTYSSVLDSTASLSSSIMEFRTIHGRTYHNTSIANNEYWGPNDEKHLASADILHHSLMMVLDNKVCRAKLDKEKVKKVLDVGTGTGIWAVDFADEYPGAEVIGTDISPVQPTWVPPNLKFEIDDATKPWTFADNSFDFVHIRYLNGSISDWPALFKEAYRVLKPGGAIESFEVSTKFGSDDGSVPEGSPAHQWGQVYAEAGKQWGRSFTVVDDNTQTTAMKEAGFVDLDIFERKCPVGGWPLDQKQKELGLYFHLVLEQDAEGYVLFVWSQLMGWTHREVQVYVAHLRRQMRDKKTHAWFRLRNVVAHKPE